MVKDGMPTIRYLLFLIKSADLSEVLPQVMKLLELDVTTALTSVHCAQVFYQMKHVISAARSTMLQSRKENLVFLQEEHRLLRLLADYKQKTIIRVTEKEFDTTRRKIRKSKAAILQAQYHLNLSQTRFRSTVNSLKDDANILLALQCSDKADDTNANACIEPQVWTPKQHPAKHEASDEIIVDADIDLQTSTPTRHDATSGDMNDSGLDLS